jgi:hypothetical protein
MSDESEAIHRDLMDRWDRLIRPSLVSDGSRRSFDDQNGTPPDHGGPVGDFRNEAM